MAKTAPSRSRLSNALILQSRDREGAVLFDSVQAHQRKQTAILVCSSMSQFFPTNATTVLDFFRETAYNRPHSSLQQDSYSSGELH